MKNLLLLILLGITVNLYSQDKEQQSKYADLIRNAEKNLVQGNKKQALEWYEEAFKISELPTRNLYNAACAAAETGEPEKAIKLLFRRMELDPEWYSDKISEIPYFTSLHSMPEWGTLTDSLGKRQLRIEKDYDLPLIRELNQIRETDQSIRQEYIKVRQEKSPKTDSLLREMVRIDSINQQRIIYLLETKGWAGREKVGGAGSAYFLVLQHASLEIQEKYLPLMKQAVSNGDIPASNLALYEDRIAIRKGQKQIYGTQIEYDAAGQAKVSPLEDPMNVDKRRESIGLSPMADYLKQWDIVWDPEAYSKEQ